MRERLIVKEIYEKHNEIHLRLDQTSRLADVTATGQMLVDSDTLSFVYVIEKANDYTYIIISEELWPHLAKRLSYNRLFYLTNGETIIELIQFEEELEYLVENIKGNSNYGDEMVTKVEATFL